MYYYCAYSLRIESELRLPELPCATGGGDIVIRLNEPGAKIPARSIEWVEAPEPEARLCFPGAGQFIVRGGREVIITPEPETEPGLLSLYVQGMILAALLSQRGYLLLHASVVKINEGAIAFIGPVGAGKSSMASALYARGHAVASDDNAALDLSAPAALVIPGFPALRVYPDVAACLGYDRRSLRPTHSSQIKQAQSVDEAFPTAPLPLQAIYALDQETPAGILRLSAIQSITELIRHSVPTRWAVAGSGRHLKMCAGLARSVPVFRLRTFSTLEALSGIAEEVEIHCAELAGVLPKISYSPKPAFAGGRRAWTA